MKFKFCFRCKVNKPITDFPKNRARPDGLQVYCRVCMAKINKLAGSTPHGKALSREAANRWYHRHKHELIKKKPSGPTKWERYPDKHKAHVMVAYALKKGILVKPSVCEMADGNCEGKIEAHHPNGYDKENYFNVQWLCNRHHNLIHRKTI